MAGTSELQHKVAQNGLKSPQNGAPGMGGGRALILGGVELGGEG